MPARTGLCVFGVKDWVCMHVLGGHKDDHKFGGAPVRQSSLVDFERQNNAAMELARGQRLHIPIKDGSEKLFGLHLQNTMQFYSVVRFTSTGLQMGR